ncbi:MAG: hypothetical protein K8U03_12105 [Planctomycetia bacterium]|nr:hypothetical protein [Planctomycetia bacterium]
MRWTAQAMMISAAMAAAGCEPASQPTPAAKAPAPVVEAPVFAPPPQPKPTLSTTTTTKKNTELTPADDVARHQASAAMTVKGKYEVDLITTPLTAYFTVKDQLVYQVQIPKAMQYFELANNRKPASHEEFMEQIIRKQGIKLPELMPEHRYVYDPKKAELFVEHPK